MAVLNACHAIPLLLEQALATRIIEQIVLVEKKSIIILQSAPPNDRKNKKTHYDLFRNIIAVENKQWSTGIFTLAQKNC